MSPQNPSERAVAGKKEIGSVLFQLLSQVSFIKHLQNIRDVYLGSMISERRENFLPISPTGQPFSIKTRGTIIAGKLMCSREQRTLASWLALRVPAAPGCGDEQRALRLR